MRSRLTAFIAGILITLLDTGALAAELGVQRNNVSGVTVAVTPQNLSAGAKTWDFKVVLDAHSGELNDDLVKTATLSDDKGGKHVPIAWEGAGPGGHHREGTLKFNPVASAPAAIGLRIQRQGEPAARSFRWQLK
jgi:hypothetical protein